jgi:hypothetical protein
VDTIMYNAIPINELHRDIILYQNKIHLEQLNYNIHKKFQGRDP